MRGAWRSGAAAATLGVSMALAGCGGSSATPRTSDITISDSNGPVALAAPSSALDLTR